MFKLIAIVTFLLNGATFDQHQFVYNQRFDSFEACEGIRTGDQAAASALEALALQLEGSVQGPNGEQVEVQRPVETQCVPAE